MAESQVNPSPNMVGRTSRTPGSQLPVEAAIAGPVLRLAELELERLVHKAEEPARQVAANMDAVEHEPGARLTRGQTPAGGHGEMHRQPEEGR